MSMSNLLNRNELEKIPEIIRPDQIEKGIDNPFGVRVLENGELIWTSKLGEKYLVKPRYDISKYCFLSRESIENLIGEDACKNIYFDRIKISDTETVEGKYYHRIVVYSFGDKNGRKYASKGLRNVIDHIDMNHCNNSVQNLQLVSHGINLFRAYYKTGSGDCATRFKEYYKSLDEIDRHILNIEIEQDIKGLY